MIVDDEEGITSTLDLCLQRMDGVVTTTFNNPVYALEDFKKTPENYDLVISDIGMPWMDGLDFCRELRRIRDDVSVWFLTAFLITPYEILRLIPNLKVQRLIHKPIAFDQLQEMIQQEMHQIQTRATTRKVELDAQHDNIVKVNPLADWSSEQVWHYIRENKVPYNPLHDRGFPSIGCASCTRAVKPGEDPRAGRWWWETEGVKECGLHYDESKGTWQSGSTTR
jgi:DNA-binding response OmpR family regulator